MQARRVFFWNIPPVKPRSYGECGPCVVYDHDSAYVVAVPPSLASRPSRLTHFDSVSGFAEAVRCYPRHFEGCSAAQPEAEDKKNREAPKPTHVDFSLGGSRAEPVAVPMSSLMIPFGRDESGEPHFLSGYSYPVAVGNVGLACDLADGALDPMSGVGLCDG